jgi:hypothetical protein
MKEIHEKGFNMSAPRSIPSVETDFSKIKVGAKALEDAVINLGSYKKLNPRMTKDNIQQAITRGDVDFMREASDFYFNISGIYSRLCKHLSNFYRYDWFITPYSTGDKVTPEKIIEGFNKTSYALDEFGVKEFLGEKNKVKINVKLMRREMHLVDMAKELMKSILNEINDIAELDNTPSFNNGIMSCTVRASK